MNYSEYINSRAGFVEEYEVKGEELSVKTPDIKKEKPYKFKATKETTTYFDERLGKQYQLLIEHQAEIIKDKSKKARKVIYPVAIVLLLIAAGFNFLELPQLYAMLLGTTGFITPLIGEVALAIKNDKFIQEMTIYKAYMENRKDIEQQAKQDKNILAYIDEPTYKMIEKNVELQNQDKIEDVFNIDLMDKMDLKQLKELLVRYKISQRLQEELTFSIPNQSKPKTKTLKPQDTNNKQ